MILWALLVVVGASAIVAAYKLGYHVAECEAPPPTEREQLLERQLYLIQHLAGSLWVVLAEWDLTPLEMAITRGRADR